MTNKVSYDDRSAILISPDGTKEAPLVTLALFAYNQERFIIEAVQGVLSQTYTPLEIVLSDDSSSDKTFDLMESMVNNYDGPHTIKLIRNPVNLGLGAHVSKVVREASGELIVVAAGDDISEPHRVETLLAEWLLAGKPGSICSAVSLIDSGSRVIAPRYTDYDGQFPQEGETPTTSLLRYSADGSRHLMGCSAAWNKSVFELFSEISTDVVNEDNVIGFRSWLVSSVSYCQRVLVRYRTHADNMYNKSTLHVLTSHNEFQRAEARRCKRAGWEASFLRQHLIDIARARELNLREASILDLAEANIQKRLVRQTIIGQWNHSGFLKRCAMLAELGKAADARNFVAQLVRLNGPLYCASRVTLRRLAESRRQLFAFFR